MIMPNNENERRPSPICRGYVHVVKAGETLYKLARQYDVKLFDIMRLNPYVNVYNLQIGDEICIPSAPARPERTYVVNEGDTIQRVMQALNTDFDTLARWNPMLKDVELPEGLVITIPMIQPREDRDDDMFEDFFDEED
ncbi:MAG: LysM peptidoglycan-binding domain-containing protein [Lachnospiraceae bacterium]|nr:LysM peptidoglycan-binding domain-containing protein [Lachnospiraceae bacterium]